MICPKCGRSIKESKSGCPGCGFELTVGNYDSQDLKIRELKEKPKPQVFRTILIVLLTILLIGSVIVAIAYATVDFDKLIEDSFKNESFLVINILTLFTPILIGLIIYVVGWIGIIFFDALGIIIALLTMIKATKWKKIYLLILIILFILTIVFTASSIPTE